MKLYAVAILIDRDEGKQLAVASVTADSEWDAKEQIQNELDRRASAERAEIMIKEITSEQIRELSKE